MLSSRSIPTLCRFHPRIPLRRQVKPVRVLADNQPNLLRPAPSFKLGLARERPVDVVIRFPVQQTSHLVSGGESIVVMEFVLENTFVQVAAESDVQRAGQAAHDVHAVASAIAKHSGMIVDLASLRSADCHKFCRCSHIGNSCLGRDASTPPENRFALLPLRSA